MLSAYLVPDWLRNHQKMFIIVLQWCCVVSTGVFLIFLRATIFNNLVDICVCELVFAAGLSTLAQNRILIWSWFSRQFDHVNFPKP